MTEPMNDSADNCLIERFTALAQLSDGDVEILQRFFAGDHCVSAGETLRRRGEVNNRVTLVKSGWLCTQRMLPNASVQLVDVKLPGDMIGLSQAPFVHWQTSVVALTDCEVCSFPKRTLQAAFARSPRLTTLLFFMMAREQAYLVERLTEAGRRDAYSGLASFLLMLAMRLDGLEVDINRRFQFPLTQRHVADALGITPVHTSRVIQRFRAEGIANIRRGWAEILNPTQLIKIADQQREYFTSDRRWLEVGVAERC